MMLKPHNSPVENEMKDKEVDPISNQQLGPSTSASALAGRERDTEAEAEADEDQDALALDPVLFETVALHATPAGATFDDVFVRQCFTARGLSLKAQK